MEMYVVQVKSGCEKAVLTAFKRNKITAYAPIKIFLIRRGSKWIKEEKIIFPGYMFIECNLSTDDYYIIKGITGVIRILGANNIPSPIPIWEKPTLQLICNNGDPIGISEAEMIEGRLIVTSGLIGKLCGKIIKYNPRQKRATIRVTVAGRVKDVALSVDIK